MPRDSTVSSSTNAVASIVWFRHDLRLTDNPALTAAIARAEPIIPVFVWSPREDPDRSQGAASRWWLHESLTRLCESLRKLGSRLIVRTGDASAALRLLVSETRTTAIFWNRRYDPAGAEQDRKIEASLRANGVQVSLFNASLLREPHEVLNQQGRPFQIFTAYWRACTALAEPAPPSPAQHELPVPTSWPASLEIAALGLQPRHDWTQGLNAAWTPGEAGAHRQLDEFLRRALIGYSTGRDRPADQGTSRLSPHLQHGEISPRQIWRELRNWERTIGTDQAAGAAEAFLRELGWRDFAHQLLFHFPRTVTAPLKPQFAKFPWVNDSRALRGWQRGQTGYPIVDAGMRELWTTGWMHNRVRMIVGSFLVKHLLIDWRHGAAWFWDTLVDADLANNTLGWQWVAGCGADAAPYFRIFNPVLQGRKFDAHGAYVRRWVPELNKLETRWIHAPWEAPDADLDAAGIALGRNYPRPIVEHAFARQRALDALAETAKKTPPC